MRNIIQLMLIAFLLVSCGGKQSQEKSDAKSEASSKSQTLTKQLEKKKYPLEHGIIYQKVSAAGFETKPVIYFDKWGDWQATETSMNMEMMGVKAGVHSIDIVKGDEHWDINLEEIVENITNLLLRLMSLV